MSRPIYLDYNGTALSHVLRALGVEEDVGRGTVRFSTGKKTTETEIDQALQAVAANLSPA